MALETKEKKILDISFEMIYHGIKATIKIQVLEFSQYISTDCSEKAAKLNAECLVVTLQRFPILI